MKTAVDTSVLLDVLGADAVFGETSREALRRAFDAGALLTCDVVWAEVRAHFPSDAAMEDAMATLGVTYEPMSSRAADSAGALWRKYHRIRRRPSSPEPRRIVADFLIGAHAEQHAEALLTRDRGFYRRWFRRLRIIEPNSPESPKTFR